MESEGMADQSRRWWLQACGAASIGVVAGCVGGSVSDDGGVLTHRFPYHPEQIQFNPWAPNYPWAIEPLVFAYRSVTSPGGDPQLEHLITDVSIDGRCATVKYDDSYVWWNGDPVTARDDWIYHRLRDFVGGRQSLETVDLLGEFTLQYTFDRPYNRHIVLEAVAGGFVHTPRWLFGEWLDQLEDVTTDVERESIVKELQSWWLPIDRVVDDGIGCAPYQMTEATKNRVVMDRFEKHPHAGDLSIPRLFLPVAQRDRRDQMLTQGEIDAGNGCLTTLKSATPDHIQQLASYPTDGGFKLVLNWRNDHLGHRGVRRAILATLPLGNIAGNADWGEPVEVQTGMHKPSDDRWLAEFQDRLYHYPVDADLDAAATFMQNAGYHRQEGWWEDADGEQIELTLRTPTWDAWTMAARTIGEALTTFGIETEVLIQEPTTFRTRVQGARYGLALWWGDSGPFAAYNVTATDPSRLGYGQVDSTQERSPRNKPIRPKIPRHPGQLATDGETTEVNLVHHWNELQGRVDDARHRELIRLFAQWWNYDLPDIQLASSTNGVWGNVRDFDWPASNDERYRLSASADMPQLYCLNTGAVRPTERAED